MNFRILFFIQNFMCYIISYTLLHNISYLSSFSIFLFRIRSSLQIIILRTNIITYLNGDRILSFKENFMKFQNSKQETSTLYFRVRPHNYLKTPNFSPHCSVNKFQNFMGVVAFQHLRCSCFYVIIMHYKSIRNTEKECLLETSLRYTVPLAISN